MKQPVTHSKVVISIQPVQHLSCAALVLLFVYTALSKLWAFSDFTGQLHAQAVPEWSVSTLAWAIPLAELLTALLLLTNRWRAAGLWGAALLMTLFSAYAGLVLAGAFAQVPCSCGGVLQGMGWRTHFLFNLLFLLLSFLGIYAFNRERSVVGKE